MIKRCRQRAEIKCLKCKKIFTVAFYRRDKAVCCSRECLWHITKKQREPKRLNAITGKKSANNNQQTIKCKICDISFFISPSRKGRTKFCSIECYSIAQSGDKIPMHRKYKRIYVDGKRVHEHRHIMECHIGRKLLSTEHVHHINHNGLDNRIENLELLSVSEHTKKHSHGPY